MTTETRKPRFDTWERTLYIVWLTQFLAIAGGNLVIPFLPLFIRDLGVEDPSRLALISGIATGATGLTMFLSAPFWGSLADRFGRKRLLLRAYFGASLMFILQGLAQDVYQLIALRALSGAFVGSVAAAAALVASTTPTARVAYSMGLLQTALFLASMIGPLAGGFVAGLIGFREAFLVAGAMFAFAGAVLLVSIKEDFVATRDGRGPIAFLWGNVADVASNRSLIVIIGIVFLINSSLGFSRPIIPLFVELLEPAGSVSKHSGFAYAALAFTSAVAALMVGRYASRLGHRRTLLFMLFGAGIFYMPVFGANSTIVLVLLLGVAGLFSGGMVPSANALLSLNASSARQGSAFGLAGSASSLGQAIGPMTGGAVAAALGVRAVFLVVGGIVLTAAFVSTLCVKEPAGQDGAKIAPGGA